MEIVRDTEEPEKTYAALVRRLDALSDASRGTGTKTAILASALAWQFATRPREGLLVSANLLQSDTDTIATMAGALLGVVASSPPHDELCDLHYIGIEAKRLYDVSLGVAGLRTFPYPDLVEWEAPRTQGDAVLDGGKGTWNLSGLGPLEPSSLPIASTASALWQWFRLDTRCAHPQLLLLKRRTDASGAGRVPLTMVEGEHRVAAASHAMQRGLFEASPRASRPEASRPAASRPEALASRPEAPAGANGDSWQRLVQSAIGAGFDPAVVGTAVLRLLDSPNGFEDAVLFASALRRARKGS
jgi:hypothetical protein